MRGLTSNLTALALPLLLVGCIDLDLMKPVTFVVTPQWSAEETARIEEAVESWNLEFGTTLQVGEPSSDAQTVDVIPSDLACAFAGGLASDAIYICDHISGLDLRIVMRHEVGHALGIHSHAEDPLAVLAPTTPDPDIGRPHFRSEDRQLFHEANPDFEGTGGCTVVRSLEPSPHRSRLISFAQEGTPAGSAVIWSGVDDLRWASMDPLTGETTGAVSRIPTGTVPTWIRPLRGSAGIEVAFHAQDTLCLADLDTSSAPSCLHSALPQPKEQLRDLSAARSGERLWIAFVEESGPGWVSILEEYDLGESSSPLHSTELKGWCQVAGEEQGALLVCWQYMLFEEEVVSVQRLDPVDENDKTLFLHPQREVHFTSDFDTALFSLLTLEGQLVVILRAVGNPLHLFRVNTGPELKLRAAAIYAQPQFRRWGGQTSSAVKGQSLYLAGSYGHISLTKEVHLLRFHLESLQEAETPRRLSPADRTSSHVDDMVLVGDQVLVTWRDWVAAGATDTEGDATWINQTNSRCAQIR